ncbi:putative deoxyribodipyrimidine photo-lyase [Phaeomoniella chlamydospora]|uniref:Putative deoxyribodipyrimidine photo-lyase n=1 Tax=Phaeomoniella chlamydospora TaxID=158046 RepID=A0A0G2ESW2_PHACM|nr:putative deoxyribodipyrimidine photo-lyase [Phaeomoniella chlamydospora]
MSKRDHPNGEEHPELQHPSIKRAKEIDQSETPYEQLKHALGEQKAVDRVTHVAHWFRSKDLRIEDNTALHHASQLAQEKGVPLVTFYLMCAKEFEWHGTSPARTDFVLQALDGMQKELKEKYNIPLVFIDAPDRKDKVSKVVDFLNENEISHVFANYEYEYDELRRDIQLLDEIDDIQFSLYHDQTIVEPGTVRSVGDKPMKVFTPYHKAWLSVVKDDPSLLDTHPSPSPNDKSVLRSHSSLFETKVPSAPSNKQFASDADRKRTRDLWPAGHAAGVARLQHFLNDKISSYAETRSNPAADSTSRLSAYFSSGQISLRETLSAVRKHNKGSADFSSPPGISSWVRELCFRELYRQMLVIIPHNSLNLPQNLKYDSVDWENPYNSSKSSSSSSSPTALEKWRAWCTGQTGAPFIDAGMRQLLTESYMHNRLRMNVSSYLTHNLGLDYRLGERFFAEHLIDWDLANNTQGWEPSYTVFNPFSQAEKNDPGGDYIRKWVPELKDLKGKEVFQPDTRCDAKQFDALGYKKQIVEWKETKVESLDRLKEAFHGKEEQ